MAEIAFADLPPTARFVLRGRPAAVDAAGTALGFALPGVACRAAGAGERAALWLGPDEWLVLAPEAEGAALAAALEAAMAAAAHSLVDVGHRQDGFVLRGSWAAVVLNAGCPLNLDPAAFPIGMCTRTVLAKAEIVLWRTGAEAFRVEAMRSFLPYVRGVLAEAAREFAA
ncbi:MAG: sarcosine oxidase subunit gamma [Alphaproteobacteria bacterium]|nr:sarcosine oxidase subunit gamma [Alphaproteobacteria bacterium]